MTILATDVIHGAFLFLWGALYLALLITLGVLSLRKGHWVMFVIGIFIPLFWLIGALIPSRRPR
jgi:hypothetical protein